MKISIITVCYNSSQFIRTAIESVLAQTYPDVEYIVIDGASSDNTLDIIYEYSDHISHIVSEPDEGLYDAMNKGLALVSGDVVGILNSDDFFLSSTVIADIATMLREKADADMILANVDFVQASDLSTPVRLYSSFNFSPWQLRFGFMPSHTGAFIKSSAYTRVGNYKLGYKSGADFDIFTRMLAVHKLKYERLNQTVIRMRLGGISTSGWNSYITSTKEILNSLKENGIYSNIVMLSIRFPIKFFQIILFKAKFNK